MCVEVLLREEKGKLNFGWVRVSFGVRVLYDFGTLVEIDSIFY